MCTGMILYEHRTGISLSINQEKGAGGDEADLRFD